MSNTESALRRIEQKLIQGGAALPVKQEANGVEHGLSIALLLVREEIEALAAAPAAIPAGWKLVPCEPTDEMIDAARRTGAGPGWSDVYPAMLDAAPAAPAAEQLLAQAAHMIERLGAENDGLRAELARMAATTSGLAGAILSSGATGGEKA